MILALFLKHVKLSRAEYNCYFINHLTSKLHTCIYLIVIFTHLNLCLTDAIHNFKWEKIIKIWQNGG